MECSLQKLGLGFWAASAILFLTSLGLAFVPLFNLLAYEFCAVLSTVISLTAGMVAFSVFKPKRSQIIVSPPAPRIIFALYFRVLFANWLSLLLPLLVISLNALRVKNCNFSEGLIFFGLLPMATSMITTAWGLGAAMVSVRTWIGGLVYAGIWLFLVAFNLMEFWLGPQIDSYNQITGFIAGPIFDEVVTPGAALFFSRLFGLTWALAWLFWVWLFFAPKQEAPSLGLFRQNKKLSVWALGLLGLGCLFWICRNDLGFGRSYQKVESHLSETIRTQHFLIHLAPDLPEKTKQQLAKDHEFRFSQIISLMGPVKLPTINSYVFPSAELKKKLVGAKHTQYAKPWNYALFLNGTDFPHPILKHELSHVVSAGFSGNSFGAPFLGIWPNVGLMEGLAVAIEWPTHTHDPHTWSAAQRRQGLAPDMRTMFDPIGFWTKPAKRSYIVAGSFIRYLLDHYGPKLVRQAYAAGRIEGVFGKSQEELVAEWETFLDQIQLPPEVIEMAGITFSTKSIFGRICAHEIAALRQKAQQLLWRDKTDQAFQVAEEILTHIPNDLETLKFMVSIHLRQENQAAAAQLLTKLMTRSDISKVKKAMLGNQLGDIHFLQGNHSEAAELWNQLLAYHIDDATDRLLLIKLQTLNQPQGDQILTILSKRKIDTGTLLELREVAQNNPEWAAIWYLLGRQLYLQNFHSQAIPYLEKANKVGLVSPALLIENLRLISMANYFAGDLEKSQSTFQQVLKESRHQEDRNLAQDWIERIEFEKHQWERVFLPKTDPNLL